MPKKSVFAQLEARAVPPHNLLPSPRHWNPGLLRYRNKLWMAYRFHRADTPDARCGIAICEIDAKTAEPIGPSQMLRFADPGNAHHEDARLFMFRGEPHISYTDMQGYQAGLDYTCSVKYARLKMSGSRWIVVKEFQIKYGNNTGFAKEKNWVFFECDEQLHCVYQTSPEHTVLRIDREVVIKEFKTPGPAWEWGTVRGGTQPLALADGRMLSIFHSSIASEAPPAYVRYYAGGIVFEGKPPFRILQISEQPFLCGSEEDGHKVDPRYVEGWKPLVIFPTGLVNDGNNYILSAGVNDWACAIFRFGMRDLKLGAPDGSSFQSRCFRSENGSVPVQFMESGLNPVFIRWEPLSGKRGCAASDGIIRATTARQAVEISEHEGATEISDEEYERAKRTGN